MNRPPSLRTVVGFTLLEVVIVMVIIAVLAGLAVPTVTSMMREAQMRAPVENLQEVAKAARLRAMVEGFPYEVIFTAEGFEARPFRIRGEEEEEDEPEEDEEAEREEEAEKEEEVLEEPEEDQPPPLKLPEVEPYTLPTGMTARLLFWGRTRWIDPPTVDLKEQIPVHDRWIFQPSGICNPLRIQFQHDGAWVEVAFNPLTADIQSERAFFPD